MMEKWLPLMALCIVLFASQGCERGSDAPRREEGADGNGGKEEVKPPTPSGGNRPGPTDKDFDFTAELADGVVRYDGRGVTLRFDRAGVLVKVHADGRRELIDLDGTSRVGFVAGTMRTDSLFEGSGLTVDGSDIALESVRMKKQTAEAVWYHAVDSDGLEDPFIVNCSVRCCVGAWKIMLRTVQKMEAWLVKFQREN